jgi:Spy/CpxP family protein refolding chaperone
MKRLTIMRSILTGALVLSPLAAGAQPGDSMEQKPFKRMISDLKLTPDQQAKLRVQHQQMREEGKTIFEQMKKIRDKVRAELLKDKPSKAALDDYATQLAELEKQLILKRHQHLLEAKAILTPEQFSKLVNHEWKGASPEGDRPHKRKYKELHGPETGDMDER